MSEEFKDKEFKQSYLPDTLPPISPFENVNGQWILKEAFSSPDFINGKSGFQLNPAAGNSKINVFGGNAVLYDAVVDASGKGQFISIQDALNAGKKRIFVRSGTYVITTYINISGDDISIVGENKTTTIIFKAAGSNHYAPFSIGSSVAIYKNITISNLTISGNGGNQSPPCMVMSIYNVTDVVISNCNIINGRTGGIYISDTDTKRVLIQGCSFTGNAHESLIFAYGASQIWIDSNYFSDPNSSSYAIAATGGTDPPAHHIVITNNIFDTYDSGVVIHYGAYACTISTNIFVGLLFAVAISNSSTTTTKHNIITNNICYNLKWGGISLRNTSYNIVSNNTFVDCGIYNNNTYSGIIIADTATYNSIVGNTFEEVNANKLKYGIREDSVNDDYNLITNNIVQGAVTANISTQGANSVVSSNIS